MKNAAMSRDPIASFNLPSDVPPKTSAVYPRFDKLGHDFAATKGEIDDLDAEKVNIAAENIKARAAAIAAGEKLPPDSAKAEEEIEAEKKAVERHRAELSIALDSVGNELAD